MIPNLPLPRPRCCPAAIANPSGPPIVRVVTLSWPFRQLSVSRFTSALFQIMSAFDPATVRKAVDEFTPRRPEKFQDLMPAKDVIAELRQKRASYRSIADLLTQHCLPISKTAIAVFCHQVLGETVRPRKRPGRKRSPVCSSANGVRVFPSASPTCEVTITAEPSSNQNGDEE